jgi:hypothetical protein
VDDQLAFDVEILDDLDLCIAACERGIIGEQHWLIELSSLWSPCSVLDCNRLKGSSSLLSTAIGRPSGACAGKPGAEPTVPCGAWYGDGWNSLFSLSYTALTSTPYGPFVMSSAN